MAKTNILIIVTWTLLQAVGVCDTANTCVAVRACDNAKSIKSLESKVDKLQAALDSLNKDLGNLKSDVGPKVAFSASLAGKSAVRVGPGSSSQIILFKNVFFNNGNAYNQHTGTFTAPQKGAYQFTFTTYIDTSHWSGARLAKNGEFQVSTTVQKGRYDTTSGAVILSLNANDTVNMMTWGGYQIYDDSGHHTTFSGFLLFPL